VSGDEVARKLRLFVNEWLNFDVFEEEKISKTAKNTIIKIRLAERKVQT